MCYNNTLCQVASLSIHPVPSTRSVTSPHLLVDHNNFDHGVKAKNGQDGIQHNMKFREIETYETAIGKNKSKRKFTYTGLGCRGMFHKMIFSKLDRVCDECYDIFKIPEIHHLCRYFLLF